MLKVILHSEEHGHSEKRHPMPDGRLHLAALEPRILAVIFDSSLEDSYNNAIGTNSSIASLGLQTEIHLNVAKMYRDFESPFRSLIRSMFQF